MIDFKLLEGITEADQEATEEQKLIYSNIAKVQLERFQDKIKAARVAYKAWAAAINKSEILRAEMLKAAASGASEKDLLLKAIECIYMITGDKVFYKRIKELKNYE